MQLLLWTCKFLCVTHGQWKCGEQEGLGHLCSDPLLSVCNLLSCCLPIFSGFSCLGSFSVVLEVLLVGLKYFDVTPPHDQCYPSQHLTHSARFVLTKFNSKILKSVLLLSFPFDWLTAGRSFADDLWIQRLMSTSMQDIHPPWHSGWRVSADLKGTIPGLFVIPITNNMGHGPQNFFEIKIPSRSGKHSTLVGVYQRPFCWHGASPSDKKMPWVQKVAILDTRQKVGLKHQQRIEGSPGSVSIRINIWTLTELCNCQILIYLEIMAREWSLESTSSGGW